MINFHRISHFAPKSPIITPSTFLKLERVLESSVAQGSCKTILAMRTSSKQHSDRSCHTFTAIVHILWSNASCWATAHGSSFCPPRPKKTSPLMVCPSPHLPVHGLSSPPTSTPSKIQQQDNKKVSYIFIIQNTTVRQQKVSYIFCKSVWKTQNIEKHVS